MKYRIFNAIFGLFWPPLTLFFSRVARYARSLPKQSGKPMTSRGQIRLKRASNLTLIYFE